MFRSKERLVIDQGRRAPESTPVLVGPARASRGRARGRWQALGRGAPCRPGSGAHAVRSAGTQAGELVARGQAGGRARQGRWPRVGRASGRGARADGRARGPRAGGARGGSRGGPTAGARGGGGARGASHQLCKGSRGAGGGRGERSKMAPTAVPPAAASAPLQSGRASRAPR